MDKQHVMKALDELKLIPKRKFAQSYDLVINLKNLVTKQEPIDVFVTVPHSKGKKIKVAAFVDQQLAGQADQFCDLVIREADFPKYDVKKMKVLAQDYDYFIAQATLMPKVAAAFGKVLGTKGKMPNPKLGCVVPPTAMLEPLIKRLNHTVRVQSRKGLALQCMIGKETQPEMEIVDNVLAVYQAVLKAVPNETQNIKNVALKLSMSKPVRVF
ncbi:hypothetical protein HYT55_01445 [Candidatus Woesearchaeota archaeon]|nr:hypothetical protein [Candidatus Woesearchaeota archaeon]